MLKFTNGKKLLFIQHEDGTLEIIDEKLKRKKKKKEEDDEEKEVE